MTKKWKVDVDQAEELKDKKAVQCVVAQSTPKLTTRSLQNCPIMHFPPHAVSSPRKLVNMDG